MKEKIKEVQDFFKGKLLSGEFEVKQVYEHRVRIVVDGEYEFTIWTGNWQIIRTIRLYQGEFNFIHFDFSESDSQILHDLLNEPVTNFRKTELLAEKEKELNELKKELGL